MATKKGLIKDGNGDIIIPYIPEATTNELGLVRKDFYTKDEIETLLNSQKIFLTYEDL